MNNQTKNNYLIPLAIIIAGIIITGAIIYTKTFSKVSQPTEKTDEVNSVAKIEKEEKELTAQFNITENDHIRGDFSAPVTIVEFSDFQCPFCQKFHPTVQQILTDYPEKVRWVYKHFPLDQIHSEARPAAEASECVWEQKNNEGFWQFTDSLFENQERLGESLYQELAAQIGLDLDKFNDCFSKRKYKNRVEADYQEGIKAGVKGTPGSFVNGEPIPGAVPYETLKEAVERALAELK